MRRHHFTQIRFPAMSSGIPPGQVSCPRFEPNAATNQPGRLCDSGRRAPRLCGRVPSASSFLTRVWDGVEFVPTGSRRRPSMVGVDSTRSAILSMNRWLVGRICHPSGGGGASETGCKPVPQFSIASPALFTGGSERPCRHAPLPPVNNAARCANLATAPTRTLTAARSTSLAQVFARSRHPGTDTHPQVPTANVSPYTDCAPRPQPE